MRNITTIFTVLAALIVCAPVSLALGPIDGEVGVIWWQNEFETSFDDPSPSTSFDSEAPGGHASLWLFDRWGAKVGIYSADMDSAEVEYQSLDVMARVLSPTENNYLALGLGWEQINFGTVDDTSGPRVVAEGQISIVGLVKGYAHFAYLPSMDDTPNYTDSTGTEFDLGIKLKPSPFVTLRSGYRETALDRSDLLNGEKVSTSGFYLGAGFHF